jgi:hypothetical protein
MAILLLASAFWATVWAMVPALEARADDDAAFTIETLPSSGRILAAEITDFDGDGRADLVTVTSHGVPPAERRELQVRYGDGSGRLPDAPSWHAPLPAGVAAYDVAPVDDQPGSELILLRAQGVTLLSLAGREPRWRDLPTPMPTAGPAADERGLDRLRLARPELGGVRLLVPGFGTSALLGPDGAVVGQLRTGGRANYFLPPRPGPLLGENELELYFDVPRLDTGDVDGDGRVDLVAANRNELRVFLQRPDGTFASEPDRVLPLGLLSFADHVRNTGGARVDLGDWNGDGRADLLVSYASGGLLRATTQTRLYLDRDGTWNLARPDQVFENSGGVSLDQLVDVDGDGRPELMRAFAAFGVLDLVKLFLQRSIDFDGALYRADAAGRFDTKPWVHRHLSLPLSFETMRPRGFVPTLSGDWNGDGSRDLFDSAGGEGVEVWLGGPEYRFETRQARQRLDSGGRLRIGDLDGNGLPDWVLYDPRRAGVPLRIGRNRGVLPGTPPSLHAAPAP